MKDLNTRDAIPNIGYDKGFCKCRFEERSVNDAFCCALFLEKLYSDDGKKNNRCKKCLAGLFI